MYYTIDHITHFRYSEPVSESVTEIRKRPSDEPAQRCLSFKLVTFPRAKLNEYQDSWGNQVHHFNILQPHKRMEIVAHTLVQLLERNVPTAADFGPQTWERLEQKRQQGDLWDYLHPSQFVRFTPPVRQFAEKLGAGKQAIDPFTWLLTINQTIYDHFEYMPNTTTVDSHVDEVLANQAGVCQDFSHLMVTILRYGGIPARYVSGYLFHRTEMHDRSAEDATHAWVEAWLPEWGWIGFDPTNNVLVQDRHIRVAIGRDYADVPPTRGVFTGHAESELSVSVRVSPAEAPPAVEEPLLTGWAEQEKLEEWEMQQVQQQ